MYIILKLKIKSILKTVTKEVFRTIGIMILGFILISTALFIKYKPVYEVELDGEILGYVENENAFKKYIEEKIILKKGKNIESISLNQEPHYESKLVIRNKETNEESILTKLAENTTTTYKFYAVTLNGKNKAYVETLEEAEKVVQEIKNEYKKSDIKIELAINEKYTQKLEEVNTDTLEVAETSMEEEIENILQKKEAKKAIATVNGINLSVLPVSGTITSRFGVSSSIRSGAHTGLDIACAEGTDIKVVSKGTVVFAEKNGSYGNLIKVDHGNGVETWYAHCSKIYVNVGDKLKSGDIIAAVGSTGNSTGPHLHLEIRIEGKAINPQKYLYNK